MDTVYTALVFPLLLLIGQTLVALGQRKLNQRMDEGQVKTDAKRKTEAEWRDSVDQKLSELAKGISDVDDKTNRSIAVQAAQIRSDIIHKCHRYLDDLGMAGTEEKQALSDEHKQYKQFCKDLDVENDFINALVERVMHLPERDVQAS